MQNLTGFTFPHPDTPKTRPILYPKPCRRTFWGVCNTPLHGYVKNLPDFRPKPSAQDISGRMLLRPTRVCAKFGGFHISVPGYAKNPPGFIPKPSSRLFEGRMQYAPTRVRAKFDGFHISAPEYTKNVPGFTFPNKDTPKSRPVLHPNRRRRDISGRMLLRPTRIHEKFDGFHISSHGYTQNPPDFTLPNRDTPKTRPILGANRRRGFFGGVCNTPLHGYVHNLSGIIFPNRDAPKFRPVLGANPCRRTFQGVCNAPLHGYVKNPSNFTFPNKDTPKTSPVLGPNLCRGVFWGVCNAPLHGYMKNLTSFRRKSLARDISGRMLLRPYTGTCKTRPVSYFHTCTHQKPTRFHPSQ